MRAWISAGLVVTTLGAIAALGGERVPADAWSGADRPDAAVRRPSVVLVVFDALPVRLLEDGNGAIDAVRYPNFAALARASTWYRNATTISESTRFSVPAILDGRLPRAGTRADLGDHPRNLFTLLRGRYRMNIREEATELCPPAICRTKPRGNVIDRLRRGRVGRFRATVARIGGGAPQLTFLHVLLPHEPRQYLPDGRAYARAVPHAPQLTPPDTFHRRFLVAHDLQRTLLQLEYTDKLLGELITRLKRTGTWDRTLLAITSDHGESFAVKRRPAAPFRVGELNWHRAVSRANLQDIAPVAMFVKYPRQPSGGGDARFVRTTDLLPTVLDVTRTPRPPGLIGHSLRANGFHGYRTVRVIRQDGSSVSMSRRRLLTRAGQSLRVRIGLFGTGTRSLYRVGPRQDLLGKPVADIPALARTRLRARVYGTAAYRVVRPASGYVPTLVRGWLTGGPPSGRTLAFALNGLVVATAPSYPSMGNRGINFIAMLPDTALRAGANDLRIYEVAGAGLRPLN